MKMLILALAAVAALFASPVFAQSGSDAGGSSQAGDGGSGTSTQIAQQALPTAATESATPPSPCQVLMGAWKGDSTTDNLDLTLGAFNGEVASTASYLYNGRPVPDVTVKAESCSPLSAVKLTAKNGLRMDLNYSDTFGGMLRGKAYPPGGGTAGFDVTFYRAKPKK